MATRVNQELQTKLIDQLRNLGAGQAEGEEQDSSFRFFMPIKEHLRALDTNTVLIVGNRGTGKSALFKILSSESGMKKIQRVAPDGIKLPKGRAIWVNGYRGGEEFPDRTALEWGLRNGEEAFDFWNAYLVRSLKKHLNTSEAVRELTEIPAPDVERIMESFRKRRTELLIELDALDKQQLSQNQWIFIGYDELDTLHPFNYEVNARGVEGLISFWAGHSRRWQRLRAKLFLRTDMYRKHSQMGGAELAKLSANRVELQWTDLDLYTMLIKRIANRSSDLLQYCEAGDIVFESDKDFAFIPAIRSINSIKPFFKRFVGEFMGSGSNKGFTHTWVINHIRDGKKEAHPRNLVLLIEKAAEKERGVPKATPPHLLHHTSLNQALSELSSAVVFSAASDWLWMNDLKLAFASSGISSVPITQNQLMATLNAMTKTNEGIISGMDRSAFIELLKDLGIITPKPVNRFDIPDIYLRGLGLSRKGGVRKR